MNFQCPHCSDEIIIEEKDVNCGIFRHAMMKDGKQVDPHASKETIEKLIKNKEIFGCGMPFRLLKRNGTYSIEICDFI